MQQLLTGKKRLLDENGVRFSGEWVYLTFDNAFIVANKNRRKSNLPIIYSKWFHPFIIDQKGKSRIQKPGYCNNFRGLFGRACDYFWRSYKMRQMD